MPDVINRSLSDIWAETLEALTPSIAAMCRHSVMVDFLLDDHIEITAPSAFVLEHLTGKLDLLERKLGEIGAREIKVRLKLDRDLKIREPDDDPAEEKTGSRPKEEAAEPEYYLKPKGDWTFETFQHGTYNRVAYFTAERMANWDPACPPIFLLASSGSGKSHLAHAIWQKALQNRPGGKVVYVHSKAFMNHYRRIARQEGPRGEEEKRRFRERYHRADLFIMDDAHRLFDVKNDWVKSRDEFRDILDDLKDLHALVMVISELPVNGLINCEENIRSRLLGMVLVKLEPPDYQARTQILKRLLENKKILLPAEQAEKLVGMILERISYDMRELTEQAPAKLANYIKALDGAPVDEEMIIAVFGEQATNPRLTIGIIQEVVARKFKMTVRDLRLKRREYPVPWTIAVYLCSAVLRASAPDIALTFEVDVQTVHAALRGIGKRDGQFFEEIGDIQEQLASL